MKIKNNSNDLNSLLEINEKIREKLTKSVASKLPHIGTRTRGYTRSRAVEKIIGKYNRNTSKKTTTYNIWQEIEKNLLLSMSKQEQIHNK